MKKRAAIFDLDGTVIDSEIVWDDAARALLGRRGKIFDREGTKPLMMGKHIRDSTEILMRTHGVDEDVDTVVRERRELVREYFAKEVRFVDGAREFIEKIKPTWSIAIATALDKTLLAVVEEKLGLSELFGEHIYSVEDIGNISKPDPAIFLYAAKQLGVAPEHCIVLEDAPMGVLGAKNAGMKCVALTTSTTRDKLSLADSIVDAYSEIRLEEILA